MEIFVETINGSIRIVLGEQAVENIERWTNTPEERELVEAHLKQRAHQELRSIMRYVIGTGEQIRGIIEPDDDIGIVLSATGPL